MNIDLVRKEIPVTSRRAYFDNAGTGPPSINVLNAIHEYLTDWRDYGENWEEWLPIIIELGDADISIHKRDLPHHKMRRVMILRCSRCGNVVTDSYAQYSPERNKFWCKNCISEAGADSFHSP